MIVIFCTNCGTKLDEGGLFCTNCGFKIAQEITTVREESITETTPEITHTPPQQEHTQSQESETPPPKKNSTKSIILVVAIFGALGIIFGILWGAGVLSSGRGNQPNRTEYQQMANEQTNEEAGSEAEGVDIDTLEGSSEDVPDEYEPEEYQPDHDEEVEAGNDEPYVAAVSVASIPAEGGEIRIDGVTEVSFTPSRSGLWMFRTSDRGTYDPFLELIDCQGNLVAYNDDGGGGRNALIVYYLNEGQSYTIEARFFGSRRSGSFSLLIEPAEMLPVGGGDAGVTQHRLLGFTPDYTGYWAFRTHDNLDSDPILTLFDSEGNTIATDDDSGDGQNATIVRNLSAGQQVFILAGFAGDGAGQYRLIAEVTEPPEVDVNVALNGIGIPPNGGRIEVNGATELEFTPAYSGLWVMRTVDRRGDPLLRLSDRQGNVIAVDDDGGGGLNALIVSYLEAGVTYTIEAQFFAGGAGSFTLVVAPAQTLAPETQTVRVNEVTAFLFTPTQSGTWEFTTSNNDGDPLLAVFDNGNRLAFNDDGGTGLNALIRLYLSAGNEYIIYAGFFNLESSFDLNIERR